uniref:Putative secreted protein n=4 Tax=Nyssorhynchus TaxID=44543 RepID=A0A2M4DLS8_ANODA
MIWLSSSSSSDLSSASLLLLFFTISATSERERRSVATSRNFSAPSLIFSSLRISRRIASLISSSRSGSRCSDTLSGRPYLWLSSYSTGCLM